MGLSTFYCWCLAGHVEGWFIYLKRKWNFPGQQSLKEAWNSVCYENGCKPSRQKSPFSSLFDSIKNTFWVLQFHKPSWYEKTFSAFLSNLEGQNMSKTSQNEKRFVRIFLLMPSKSFFDKIFIAQFQRD